MNAHIWRFRCIYSHLYYGIMELCCSSVSDIDTLGTVEKAKNSRHVRQREAVQSKEHVRAEGHAADEESR